MRILDFSDGFESSEEPTKGSFSPANKLMEFANDAAFVTYKGEPASKSDIYFNTTLEKVRIFITGWVTIPELNSDNDLLLTDSTITAEQILSTNAQKKIVSTGISTTDFLKLLPQVIGSVGAAIEIIAADGIDPTTFVAPKQLDRFENTIFIKGVSGGTVVSHNPQIKVGSFVGQKLNLIGTSDSLSVTLVDGLGVNTGGQTIIFKNGTVFTFIWTGSTWTILSTNGFI